MDVILQPYYHWGRGHYKKYADSLVTDGDLLITSSLKPVTKTMIEYYLLRVLCMSICMVKLIFFYTKNRKINTLFINEAEPISLLFFSPFFLFRSHDISLTLHSVDKAGTNFLDSTLVFVQRKIMFIFLRIASCFEGVRIFVHTKTHKQMALNKFNLASEKVFVVEYPCPPPIHLEEVGSDLLFFGAVRSDKSLGNFIESLIAYGDKGLDIYVVGKIYDDNVLRMVSNAPKFIKFVNKHVSESELIKYANASKFFLVPYGNDYAGGAGPIKDAASFGRPVLATELPIFKELSLIKNCYIKVFVDAADFYKVIHSIDCKEYNRLSRNAISYADDNNWSNFKSKYLTAMKKVR